MQGQERYCNKCGHRCHCYHDGCQECHNDICVKCNCNEAKKDIPDTFLKRN